MSCCSLLYKAPVTLSVILRNLFFRNEKAATAALFFNISARGLIKKNP